MTGNSPIMKYVVVAAGWDGMGRGAEKIGKENARIQITKHTDVHRRYIVLSKLRNESEGLCYR